MKNWGKSSGTVILSYIASHDLQSPISNIEGLVNGLKDSYPHPVEFEEAIEMIGLSVKRFRTKIAEPTEVA